MQRLAIPLLFILSALYFARIFPPAASTDTYFHLSIGREVAEKRQIPQVDNFTFVSDGQKWISNEWLSGLIFYFTYLKFSAPGLIVLRVITALTTIFFLYKTLTILKIDGYLKILATTTATVVVAIRLLDRPEMFSFVLLALIVYLLTVYSLKPKITFLLPLVPIFIIWPNIQGYAPLGLATFGYLALRKILQQKQQVGSNFQKALVSQKFLVVIFLAAILVSIIQFKRFFYVLFLNTELFAYVAEVQTIAQKLAGIKYNFYSGIPPEIYIYVVFSLAGLLSFLPRLKSKNPAILACDILYFTTLLVVAFLFVRVIPVYILLTAPLAANNLNSGVTPALQGAQPARILLLAPAGLLIILIAASTLQGKIVGDRTNSLYAFDKSGKILVATSSTWMPRQPTSALEFIKTNLNPQKVLTSLNWSSQVIWQLEGRAKVVGDIIYEKQTPQTLADYQKLKRAQDGWQEILSKYNPDVIINTQPFNLVEFFEVPVWELADWSLVYVDDVAAVWVKNPPVHLKLGAIHPEFSSDFKFKEEEKEQARPELEKLLSLSQNNSFANRQLILADLLENEPEMAQGRIQEAKKRFPKDPSFQLLEAALKVSVKDCPGATGSLKQAKKLATGYFYILDKVAILAKRCGLTI